MAGESRNTADSCDWGKHHPGKSSCKHTRPIQEKVLVSRDISVVSTVQRQLEDSSKNETTGADAGRWN